MERLQGKAIVQKLMPGWRMTRRCARGFAIVCLAAFAAACNDATPTSASSPKALPFGNYVIAIEAPLRRMYVGGNNWTNYVSFTDATIFTGDASSFEDVVSLYQAGYLVGASGTGWYTGGGFGNTVMTAATFDVHKSGPVYGRWELPLSEIRSDLFGGIPTFTYPTGRAILLIPPDAVIEPASPIPSLEALGPVFAAGMYVCVTADTIEVAPVVYRATRYSMRPQQTRTSSCAP